MSDPLHRPNGGEGLDSIFNDERLVQIVVNQRAKTWMGNVVSKAYSDDDDLEFVATWASNDGIVEPGPGGTGIKFLADGIYLVMLDLYENSFYSSPIPWVPGYGARQNMTVTVSVDTIEMYYLEYGQHRVEVDVNGVLTEIFLDHQNTDWEKHVSGHCSFYLDAGSLANADPALDRVYQFKVHIDDDAGYEKLSFTPSNSRLMILGPIREG